MVGEADGAEAHDLPMAVFRDRTRQNDIVAAGYWPVRFAWPDTNRPGYVPSVIRAAVIAARNARPPACPQDPRDHDVSVAKCVPIMTSRS